MTSISSGGNCKGKQRLVAENTYIHSKEFDLADWETDKYLQEQGESASDEAVLGDPTSSSLEPEWEAYTRRWCLTVGAFIAGLYVLPPRVKQVPVS